MTAQQPETAPDERSEQEMREELRTVEEEIADLRRTVAQMRARVGGREEGATDPEEQAAALTAADEQEALISALEGRRDRLRQRLGQP